jgi:hypothetical protein
MGHSPEFFAKRGDDEETAHAGVDDDQPEGTFDSVARWPVPRIATQVVYRVVSCHRHDRANVALSGLSLRRRLDVA